MDKRNMAQGRGGGPQPAGNVRDGFLEETHLSLILLVFSR